MCRMTMSTGLAVGCFICWIGLIGCSSKPTPRTEDPGASNLRKIGQAYDHFTDVKRRAPRNDDELKPMLKELDPKTDPDRILLSGRDGQPYVIHYGPPMNSDTRMVILAHEKDGAEGKRYVLTLDRMVIEMSDAEFATAKFAVPSKSQPN